jgi:hypothetical protein
LAKSSWGPKSKRKRRQNRKEEEEEDGQKQKTTERNERKKEEPTGRKRVHALRCIEERRNRSFARSLV